MDKLEQHGVKVAHHFSEGVYAKETFIPAGVTLHQHIHPYTHMSVLAQGKVRVTKGEVTFVTQAPDCLEIAAGVSHKVEAITPAVWYCIHATEETDAEKIDTVLLND